MPAANQAFRGASLYAGIFDDPPSDAQQQGASSSQSGQEASASAVASSATGADSAAASSSKSSGWSAALRFAPRRTGGAKPKSRPNAAFVASFAPIASSDQAEQPGKTIHSPAPTAAASTAAQGTDACAKPIAASSVLDEQGKSERSAVETSDLKLAALALPHSSADDTWLAAELDKYRVAEAPPYVLPSEELERDRALARHTARGDEYDEAEADEDVNGFFATSAGKRAAKKKKKRKRGMSPVGPSLNGEYDPRVPNDYLAYKQMVYDRRCAQLEQQRWQEYDNEADAPHTETSWSAPYSGVGGETLKMTGQEAYARRAAMSASTGEEAYQRRMAMSQPPAPGPPPRPPPSLAQAQPDVDARQNAAAIAARLAALAPPPKPNQP